MKLKISLVLVAICTIAISMSVYYSDKFSSERNFETILDTGVVDKEIILQYLQLHQDRNSKQYRNALLMAAIFNESYLDEVINQYISGSLIISTTISSKILTLLPSQSIAINTAAGLIYATEEFNHYSPIKAVKHLQYAALMRNRNAAAKLSEIYSAYNCSIEAITWAREANKRDISSECTQLPVNLNLLSENELDSIAYNESELKKAEIENRLANLRYSIDCPINQK